MSFGWFWSDIVHERGGLWFIIMSMITLICILSRIISAASVLSLAQKVPAFAATNVFSKGQKHLKDRGMSIKNA